jgi:hypothetical protein
LWLPVAESLIWPTVDTPDNDSFRITKTRDRLCKVPAISIGQTRTSAIVRRSLEIDEKFFRLPFRDEAFDRGLSDRRDSHSQILLLVS